MSNLQHEHFQEQRMEFLTEKLLDNYEDYLHELVLDELYELFDGGGLVFDNCKSILKKC